MKNNDDRAQFPAPGEIRIMRTLPGPIERIWTYLTDPAKRAKWFAGGPMELRSTNVHSSLTSGKWLRWACGTIPSIAVSNAHAPISRCGRISVVKGGVRCRAIS